MLFSTNASKADVFCVHSDSSSEGRPFRLGTGANMEKVVKMDRDMTKVRKEIGNYWTVTIGVLGFDWY